MANLKFICALVVICASISVLGMSVNPHSSSSHSLHPHKGGKTKGTTVVGGVVGGDVFKMISNPTQVPPSGDSYPMVLPKPTTTTSLRGKKVLFVACNGVEGKKKKKN
jgi:hypothetical protein